MEATLLVNRTAGRASLLFRRMSLALLYSHVDDALADSVSTSSYPQFTPINAQVHDVTNYLGWLKMQTAFPKAVVASTDIITAGLSLRVQLAGPLNIPLHSPYLLVCDFMCPHLPHAQ